MCVCVCVCLSLSLSLSLSVSLSLSFSPSPLRVERGEVLVGRDLLPRVGLRRAPADNETDVVGLVARLPGELHHVVRHPLGGQPHSGQLHLNKKTQNKKAAPEGEGLGGDGRSLGTGKMTRFPAESYEKS